MHNIAIKYQVAISTVEEQAISKHKTHIVEMVPDHRPLIGQIVGPIDEALAWSV